VVNRIVALAVILLVAAPAAAQPPRAAPVDAKFVTPQFFAALVFEPARLEKSANALGLPIKDAWKALEGIASTDVKQFERVTVLIDPLPGGNVAFMPAFVLRYPAGTDARKQLPALLGEVKEAKVGDVAYVRSTKYQLAKAEMAGYVIDDRTLLVAAWPTLEPMLQPRGAKEKEKDRVLGAELASADLAADVVLIVTPAPALKRMAEIEKESGKSTDMPPEVKKLLTALERVQAMTVAVDLGKDPVIRAGFRCDNAAAAGAVRDALKGVLALAKDAYPGARKDFEKDLPPEAGPILAILDAAVNDHTLKSDGDTVTLTVPRPKGLTPKK
jgi:hypothetical protein